MRMSGWPGGNCHCGFSRLTLTWLWVGELRAPFARPPLVDFGPLPVCSCSLRLASARPTAAELPSSGLAPLIAPTPSTLAFICIDCGYIGTVVVARHSGVKIGEFAFASHAA